jgi:AraC family transcriptional regulator, arabinose operon regulatory protein
MIEQQTYSMNAQHGALMSAHERAIQGHAARVSMMPSSLMRPRTDIQLKDHLYLVPHGVIYTSPWLSSRATSRGNGCILLTAQRKPFELSFGKRTLSHNAVAIPPLQERALRAENCQLVSIMVHPTHREYRRFRAIAGPGFQILDRDAFATLDALLYSAYLGELGIQGADELLEKAVAITVRYLPPIRSNDVRTEQILGFLREQPNCQLSELAANLGVSMDRMSHLFTRVVGLPWRSFQLWQKVNTVGSALGSGRRLTEIATAAGFSDAAHLSNTWQQAFGAAPSKFFNQEHVQVHYGLDAETALQTSVPRGVTEKIIRVCPHCGIELED